MTNKPFVRRLSFVVSSGVDAGIHFDIDVGLTKDSIFLNAMRSSRLCNHHSYGYTTDPDGSVNYGSCIYYSHEKFQSYNCFSPEVLKGIADCVDQVLALKAFI